MIDIAKDMLSHPHDKSLNFNQQQNNNKTMFANENFPETHPAFSNNKRN